MVVSVYWMSTSPVGFTSTSYTSPRSTMLMPSSGSTTLFSASRTCSSEGTPEGAGASCAPSMTVSGSCIRTSLPIRTILSFQTTALGQKERGAPPMAPIRALIVDDHPVTREGLRTALSMSDDAVVVVGEAASGEEAVDVARDLSPDVVFMDVRMPGMDGIEATRRIREASPETRVILITIDESRGAISEAIQAGVSGYLLTDASPDAVVDAASNAVEGNAVIHPQLTKTFIEEVHLAETEGQRSTPLSKREREILQKVADGATTRQ